MTGAALPIALSHRLEAADAREVADGLCGLASRLGADAAGVDVRSFGRGVAVVCRCLPTSLYNRVIGFGVRSLDRLDDVIAFYRDRDTPPRFDIIPEFCTPELAAALHERGFRHRTNDVFSNLMMYRVPTVDVPPPPDGLVIRAIDRSEAKRLGEIHAAGLGYPSPTRDYLGLQLEARLDDPHAYGFLAEVDGHPAAGGLLSVTDGIGYFGHASTMPAFRGRGCQTALLHARQKKAAELGCDHVVTFPVPHTTSHRNTERCGMTLAHRLQIWMDVEVERE